LDFRRDEEDLGISGFGGDDFAILPRKQGEVPAFVIGSEFFGHGFGGGLATLDSGDRLRVCLGFA
jgi:hypothetical protein